MNIAKHGLDMSNTSRTNWAQVDALADDEIDTSDTPPLTEEFFQRARWRVPVPPRTVLVQVDAETLAWYQTQGEAAEEEMAAALRIYAEAHRAHRALRKAA